jgi:hypothetical protein
MKRRITVEQLMELTEEQQQRLREWWKPEPGDAYYSPCNDGTYQPYGCYIWHNDGIERPAAIPALSIGQMIELLQEKYGEDWIDRIYSVDYDHNIYPLHEGKFIDALWAEVKQVLKRGEVYV